MSSSSRAAASKLSSLSRLVRCVGCGVLEQQRRAYAAAPTTKVAKVTTGSRRNVPAPWVPLAGGGVLAYWWLASTKDEKSGVEKASVEKASVEVELGPGAPRAEAGLGTELGVVDPFVGNEEEREEIPLDVSHEQEEQEEQQQEEEEEEEEEQQQGGQQQEEEKEQQQQQGGDITVLDSRIINDLLAGESPSALPEAEIEESSSSEEAAAAEPSALETHHVVTPPDKITASTLIALSNAPPFSLAQASHSSHGPHVDYVSRLKQAEADAHVIALVRQSLNTHQERLHRATSRLKDTLRSLEAMQQELLIAQSKAQEIRHERSITRERIKRQEVLDSARIQCNALIATLGAASERYANARDLMRLSVSLRRIKDALLAAGSAHGECLIGMAEVIPDDADNPLMQSALESLRTALKSNKAKPLAALRVQFEREVMRPAVELAYIPEGKGSMVTALLSKIATSLKVDGGNDGWEAVRRRIDAGEMLEAAEDLEEIVEGTASARIVRDWVNEVRSTYRALQAIDVLESYCYLNV